MTATLRTAWTIARKDLRALSRVPSAMFFSLAWPLLMAILFGMIFGGDSASAPIRLQLVDEDRSPASASLVDSLKKRVGIDATSSERAPAIEAVRRGKAAAAVIVPAGYGVASQRMFYGLPPEVEVYIDPSRRAERAMLEGMLMEQGAKRFQTLFSGTPEGRKSAQDLRTILSFAPPGSIAGAEHLDGVLRELDLYFGAGGSSGSPSTTGQTTMVPLLANFLPVEPQYDGPTSSFSVTFPQGILWGAIGAALSFVVGMVGERTQGTLLRLRIAPLSMGQVMAGKGLSCAVALLLVQSAVLAVGVAFFRVRPQSWPLLFGTALLSTLLFVGLMLFISSGARNEQAASGAGWALFLPLAMLGGAMVPLAFMPAWMTRISNFSPFKWVLLAYEGAIWRGFDLREILPAWSVLFVLGALGCGLGVWRLQRAREW